MIAYYPFHRWDETWICGFKSCEFYFVAMKHLIKGAVLLHDNLFFMGSWLELKWKKVGKNTSLDMSHQAEMTSLMIFSVPSYYSSCIFMYMVQYRISLIFQVEENKWMDGPSWTHSGMMSDLHSALEKFDVESIKNKNEKQLPS